MTAYNTRYGVLDDDDPNDAPILEWLLGSGEPPPDIYPNEPSEGRDPAPAPRPPIGPPGYAPRATPPSDYGPPGVPPLQGTPPVYVPPPKPITPLVPGISRVGEIVDGIAAAAAAAARAAESGVNAIASGLQASARYLMEQAIPTIGELALGTARAAISGLDFIADNLTDAADLGLSLAEGLASPLDALLEAGGGMFWRAMLRLFSWLSGALAAAERFMLGGQDLVRLI